MPFCPSTKIRMIPVDPPAPHGDDCHVHSDAHFHPVDLAALEPGFAALLPGPDWMGCLASHDRQEWERSGSLRGVMAAHAASGIGGLPSSFGIHPQNPVMDDADFLRDLASSRSIACIGEAGFDFFADRKDRVRNAENLRIQRDCFEFQLDLARETGLPLLIHMRRATDLVMAYSRRLAKLRSVIFHCWPGRAPEGEEFLSRGVNAYFSFGTSLLRDGPRAGESCAHLPESRILSETDAPWQPPRGEGHSSLAHIARVESHIAKLRDADLERAQVFLRGNFLRAFGLGEAGG